MGGALVPMVTNAVYLRLFEEMDAAGARDSFSYMGGSSLLSGSDCPTTTDSLACIWRWDQGRYAGGNNAVEFYKGNRDPRKLTGAGMMSKAVGNYWRVFSEMERCPCGYHQRYGAVLREDGGAPYWSDTSATVWSYSTVGMRDYYTLCLVEQTTTAPPTTTAKPREETYGGLTLPWLIGVLVGGAVALGVIVVLIVCLSRCCGCCGSAGPATAANTSWFDGPGGAHLCGPNATASQRGCLSRANSVRSQRVDFDDTGSRSFRNDASSKSARSRHSSFRDDVVMEEWQDDDEVTSVVGPRCRRTSSASNVSTAVPPGAVTMTMTVSAQMIPMPLQLMPMPSQMMREDWQTWDAPQPVEVYATGPPDSLASRRPPSVNFAE